MIVEVLRVLPGVGVDVGADGVVCPALVFSWDVDGLEVPRAEDMAPVIAAAAPVMAAAAVVRGFVLPVFVEVFELVLDVLLELDDDGVDATVLLTDELEVFGDDVVWEELVLDVLFEDEPGRDYPPRFRYPIAY